MRVLGQKKLRGGGGQTPPPSLFGVKVIAKSSKTKFNTKTDFLGIDFYLKAKRII